MHKFRAYLAEPGFKGVAGPIGPDVLVKLEKRLLDEVQGILLVVDEGIGQDKDLLLIKAGERHERAAVAGLDPADEDRGLVRRGRG